MSADVLPSSSGPVGLGRVQVGPWEALVSHIYQELDPTFVQHIIEMAEAELDIDNRDEGQSVDGLDEAEERRHRFFRIAQYGSSADDYQKVRFLQRQLGDLQLHTEYGEKWADIIEQMIDKLETFKDQFKVSPNDVFLGREEELSIVKDHLLTLDVKGVCICGLGGQGKTSLARQVCYRLVTEQAWKCVIVDLREKGDLLDVMKAIVVALKKDILPQYPTHEQLKRSIQSAITTTDENTVWLLDDCDRVLEGQSRMNNFVNFLRETTTMMENMVDGTKVKFLVTTRQKLVLNDSSLAGPWKEIQLSPLSVDEAMDLVKKLTEEQLESVPEEILDEIVRECAYSPLALTVVAGMLRDKTYTPKRLMFHLKMDERNVTTALKVDRCIKQAFDFLDKSSKNGLIKLSVFQSSPFSEGAAREILHGSDDHQVYNSIEVTSIIENLHRRHLLEIEEVKSFPDGRGKGRGLKASRKQIYSLHPLVSRYMAELNLRNEFKSVYDEAVKNFMAYFETVISTIVKLLNSKCFKGMAQLEENREHIMRFYTFLTEKKDSLKPPYKKTLTSKDVLLKKRLSDLSDLLICDLGKRRMFSSESGRAKDAGNVQFQIFWQVEEADVLVMLHDRPELAEEKLAELKKVCPPLRATGEEAVYKPVIHALFHKVQGLCRWKTRLFQEALDQMTAALHFYSMCRPEDSYRSLRTRILKYMGLIYMDMGDYLAAENKLTEAYEEVQKQISTKKSESASLQQLHWDLPEYVGQLGVIQLKKAQRESDNSKQVLLLNKALEFLNRGMKLDEQMKLDSLDGYYYKMKSRADVYMAQGRLDEALKDADIALSMRRELIQPPHMKYVLSVYQVALVYLKKGCQLLASGDPERARRHWVTSGDYFGELEEHHLINGSIEPEHPLVAEIKRDHLDVFFRLQDKKKYQQLFTFYQILEQGGYKSKKDKYVRDFQRMVLTPTEVLKKMFGGGGQQFGERDSVVVNLEAQAQAQWERMAEGSRGRVDSGMGNSSSEGESLSSGSGSLSAMMQRQSLQASNSMEDDVFTAGGEVLRRQSKKKSRTSET